MSASRNGQNPGVPRSVGFTLIEVLVALFIVAISLGAATRIGSAASGNTSDYRDRLLARWVAANVMSRTRLEPVLPASGEISGEETQSGQKFAWRRKVSDTPNRRFRRVDIEVGSPSAALATLSGFVMAER